MDLPASHCGDVWRLIAYARIEQRCTYCGGPIEYREPYVLHQTDVHTNACRTERFHKACAVSVLAGRVG